MANMTRCQGMVHSSFLWTFQIHFVATPVNIWPCNFPVKLVYWTRCHVTRITLETNKLPKSCLVDVRLYIQMIRYLAFIKVWDKILLTLSLVFNTLSNVTTFFPIGIEVTPPIIKYWSLITQILYSLTNWNSGLWNVQCPYKVTGYIAQ